MKINWTEELIQKEAIKYNTRNDFRKKSNKAYSAAWKKNLLDKVCAHMKSNLPKGSNHYNFVWTEEKLQEEALKYNSRSEFQKKSLAYRVAYNKGILNKICAHMKPLHNSWTIEKLQEEALKYNNRADFAKNSSAYSTAHSKYLLDKICQHMKLSCNVSNPELDLLNKIKEKFPKAQKLRDMKVLIANKPYIKGFDLDIYIPEIRKGIEFDGTYWHSVLGLKRSRKHWPEQDLKDYHLLKDKHFKSKGIDLLHITEEDWKKDKQACINKCFAFLGV